MEHHKHNTPKMILKTCQDILCFHEIVMRANPWLCSIEIPILPFVVLILGKQQTLSNMLCEFSIVQENADTIQSISLYDTFRWLQALWNTFKVSVVQTPSIDQADSCPLASRVHENAKLHSYHKVGLGVLASVRRTNSRNDHLKKSLATTLTTKMATTLDQMTGARLSWTNK